MRELKGRSSEEEMIHMTGVDQEEYVVESIIAHRGGPRKKSLEFQVRWLGYGPEDDTWESYDNVKELEALEKYLEAVKDS
ncbi:hypothetical protein ADUPG1_005738, partial [Aduncisulcus paluster]